MFMIFYYLVEAYVIPLHTNCIAFFPTYLFSSPLPITSNLPVTSEWTLQGNAGELWKKKTKGSRGAGGMHH